VNKEQAFDGDEIGPNLLVSRGALFVGCGILLGLKKLKKPFSIRSEWIASMLFLIVTAMMVVDNIITEYVGVSFTIQLLFYVLFLSRFMRFVTSIVTGILMIIIWSVGQTYNGNGGYIDEGARRDIYFAHLFLYGYVLIFAACNGWFLQLLVRRNFILNTVYQQQADNIVLTDPRNGEKQMTVMYGQGRWSGVSSSDPVRRAGSLRNLQASEHTEDQERSKHKLKKEQRANKERDLRKAWSPLQRLSHGFRALLGVEGSAIQNQCAVLNSLELAHNQFPWKIDPVTLRFLDPRVEERFMSGW
jgi:hypothetical protein